MYHPAAIPKITIIDETGKVLFTHNNRPIKYVPY